MQVQLEIIKKCSLSIKNLRDEKNHFKRTFEDKAQF